MPEQPQLKVTGLPTMGSEEAAATTSPARGAEMRNFLQARLQKNRAPPLVHSWDFWHDRQEKSPAPPSNGSNGAAEGSYEDRLEVLAMVDDVKKFWNVFNNFDIGRLALRDSVHLFHKGVKPVWEDPRNSRGGAWTFRVPKAVAVEFWRDVCLMAIGEQLQNAVESDRTTFRDDICGISLGVRFNSMLIQIWNRDGEHQEGVNGILTTVLENLSPELKLKEGSYYYKKHSEHAGFTGSTSDSANNSRPASASSATSQASSTANDQGMQSLNAIVDQGSGW
ncbi:uncharacterized protein LTR77_007504 [Saxophila tyrrhenica]|uniref:Translation initiation factor eIF4e n=1 Tax=Saxophila tyrrhenica TaxID=1690608 RepID=A0AAV9P5L0_9PEZI|nr:hypothetical protein LTR77_007504 [Saxophila tyrrhenica]